MTFLGYVRNGKRKKWLDFGRDPHHHLDFDEIFKKCPKWDKELLMVGFERPGIELPWQRSALCECSCSVNATV